jgi:hypothetical protein
VTQRLILPALWLALIILGVSSAHAQGLQSGIITGIVTSADGLPLPGVAVVASSNALLGLRSVTSDINGVYSLQGLPAGIYSVGFQRADFATAHRDDVVVNVGGTAEVHATLSLAGRTDDVTVTAESPAGLLTTMTGQSLTKRDIDALPVSRRPVDIAELAPGLTANTFTAGQLAIAGAYGFDNVFMVDGVDINDTINGTANNLYIEDAIAQTTVLTNGISAEYGRFSGGVINVVTRSGSNVFGGSVRETLSNPSWIRETPLQVANKVVNPSILGKVHEGTLGGPIARNRAWFFTAGRWETTPTANTFAQTGVPYVRTDRNRRGELKATLRLGTSDTIQGTFINNSTEQVNASGLPAARLVDGSTLVTRTLPNKLFVASYAGVPRPTVFLTLQYSRKWQQFRNNGGTSANLADSPFQTLGATGVPGGLFYHAPYLDATDPEQRNNRQFTGSVSYLVSSSRVGTHDLKAGAESFVSTGIGGNSQSSTGYVFVTDWATSGGRPVLDATNRPIPVFIPQVSQVWNFRPTRGARIDITTSSFYVQDRWTATNRLTFDLGTRIEVVRSKATGDIVAADTATVMPRLAVAYDLTDGGSTTLQATYGHYSGKYGQVQFSSNSNYVYTGPAGQGSAFAPGFDIANYTQVVFANFPTANVAVAEGLQSPLVREMTLGVGHEIGPGHVKGTYVWRSTNNFVEDFITTANGVVNVPLVGQLTRRVLDNSDVPIRSYQALLLQTDYRVRNRATLGGHYTLQIKNDGNFAGESANAPGTQSPYGDFPEILGPALDRLMPEGRLDSFQRHKLRVYGIVSQSFGRFGAVDLSPIWRINSGTVYSLTAVMTLPAAQLARNPGYPVNDINPGVRETVFFGARGEHQFKGYGVIDLATTYRLAIWKSAAPWFKLEMFNLLNNQQQIAWDRTITVDRASALDGNGIPTGYIKGPRFGQATADTHYPGPYLGQNGGRAFRVAFGVRF